MQSTAAISIDVDAARLYRAIHGLPAGADEDDPIYRLAMPRFFELMHEAKLPATVFLVGQDVQKHADVLAPLAGQAFELGNHSFRHDYGLSRRPLSKIAQDLRAAHEALTTLFPDKEVCGFRAPGYNVSRALLEAVQSLGYRYDSSLLPAPMYYVLRRTLLAQQRLKGRVSASIAGDARAFLGPLVPYRMTPRAPWRVDAKGPLVEVPIACASRLRFPLMGTTWVCLPAALRSMLLRRALARLPCFNFEMHAIDLLDKSDFSPEDELPHVQRDLAVPAPQKWKAFAHLFRILKEERCVLGLSAIAKRYLP